MVAFRLLSTTVASFTYNLLVINNLPYSVARNMFIIILHKYHLPFLRLVVYEDVNISSSSHSDSTESLKVNIIAQVKTLILNDSRFLNTDGQIVIVVSISHVRQNYYMHLPHSSTMYRMCDKVSFQKYSWFKVFLFLNLGISLFPNKELNSIMALVLNNQLRLICY